MAGPVIRLLIAALGGEGGGVLTNWLVEAADAAGIPCQATSVPGVAQRTGATTYYLEFAAHAEPAGGTPVFALMPVAGDVDIVVASELLEAVRMVERGYVTPDRTFLLASTHRVLTTHEKMARGDGRLDGAGLMDSAERASRARFLFDGAGTAWAAGAPLNAVLLGVLAGLGLLPIPGEALRAAVEAGGIAVARNLMGFDTGFDLAHGAVPIAEEGAEPPLADRPPPATAEDAGWEAELAALPEAARDVARLGVMRLAGYQDAAYARQYLERLRPFADDPVLLRAVARHLAVRMSYEDIVRVAQLKVAPGRFARVRAQVGADFGEPYSIHDFFKPGIPEIADLLPPWLGRRLRGWAERRGLTERIHLGMRVKTSSLHGFLQVWLLARLRPWRRRSLRFAEEQAAIEAWLDLVGEARIVSSEFAQQTADLARLVKGYGDTYRRGQATYEAMAEKFVRPVVKAGVGEDAPDPAAALKTAIGEALAAP